MELTGLVPVKMKKIFSKDLQSKSRASFLLRNDKFFIFSEFLAL